MGPYWHSETVDVDDILGGLEIIDCDCHLTELEGQTDVEARLALMDAQGVYAAVTYPNGLEFTSNNDWLVDVQQESGGRLLPQAVLPIWDMDLTVKEMPRLHEAGIRGFTVTGQPQLVGLPDLNDPYFAPLWSLADEIGTVISFHTGRGAGMYWEAFGRERRKAVLATQSCMGNVPLIVNLCMSDMFDRYPNVKVVSAGSGIGWVPFVLEAMEYHLDEFVTDPAEAKLQARRPAEYFRDHIYVTTGFERAAMQLLDDIGVDNVLVMTDAPHAALYPTAKEHFATVMVDLDPYTLRRTLQDNAAELYKITLPC
jgi:predicted TIM-barrel fold metal-dependent hydrolase